MYEIQLWSAVNVKVGLYFKSVEWNQIIDYNLFDTLACHQLKFCEVQKQNQNFQLLATQSVKFSLEDASSAVLTLIPKDPLLPMQARLDFRRVNRLHQRYVYETLLVVGTGLLLIALFGFFLQRALTSSLSYEEREQRLRQLDREQRRLWLVAARGNHDPQDSLLLLNEGTLIQSHFVPEQDHLRED